MSKIIIGITSTLFIIYVVPFIVYGLFTVLFGLKTPENTSPAIFLTSIFISKIGTAIAITLLFYYSKNIFYDKWMLYVLIWWTMFIINEIGQAIGPGYSWKEAIAGIISETIYLPLSVLILRFLIK